MLTLDGTLPALGGSTTGGVGMGALGGGVVGLLLGGLLGNNGGGLFGGNNRNGEAGEVAYASLQNQIQTLQGQIASNNIDAGITSINQNVSGTSRDIGRDIANLSTQAATANFTTLQSINGLGTEITAAQNQAALQNLNSFNNLTTTTLQGFNGAAMQVQNVTNQIVGQLQAQAAAAAACCCELKSAIASDGNATRALINDLNVQNLRDSLAAANNKVSNNEQNNYLLTTILAHLKPTSVVV